MRWRSIPGGRLVARDGRSFLPLALAIWSLALAQAGSAPAVVVERESLRVCVDGTPFFAIGCFGIPPEHMAECAAAGFNVTLRRGGHSSFGSVLKGLREQGADAVRSYLRGYLDAAQRAGLRVIESPLLFGYDPLWYDAPGFDGHFRRFLEDPLPQVIGAVKDHPALLAFYSLDEPTDALRAECEAFRGAVRENDPRHPLFCVFASKVNGWPEAYDIAGFDWYPVPGETPLIGVYHEVGRNAAIAHGSGVPLWYVPLMHIGSDMRMRSIGPAAQTAQVYLALAGGANGIIWWTWPPGHAGNWAAVKRLAAEMRALAPVLTEPPAPTRVLWDPPAACNTIQVRAIRRRGLTFVIAVNAAERAADVKLQLPPTVQGHAPVWFENRRVLIGKGILADRFGPHVRHVYEVHGTWAPSTEIRASVALVAPRREPPVRAADRFRPNLLHDPGFEGDLCWAFTTPAGKAEGANGGLRPDADDRGGRAAWIQCSGSATDASWVGRQVELKPNSRYSFGGWARSEQIGQATTWMYLQGRDLQVRYPTEIVASDHAPWRQYSVAFSTTDRAERVQPVCRLIGTGKAWFDDLFLCEAGVPNKVVNGGFEGRETEPGTPGWWWDIYGLLSPGHIGGTNPLWGVCRNEAFEGKCSLRMVNPHTSESAAAPKPHPLSQQMLMRNTVLYAGRPYVTSAALKGSREGITVGVYAGSWGANKEITVGTRWRRHAVSFTPKEDVLQPFVRFDLLSQGTVWLDAVQLEDGTEPTEYREWRE